MDHQDNLLENGSPLWEHLVWLLKKGNSGSLDPIPIRNLIIAKEKERILSQNVNPINRLFDLGDQEILSEKNILFDPSRKRLGQQDCKNFFICLEENRKHWADVCDQFWFESKSFTIC